MFTKEERLFIWEKVYEMIDKKCSVYVFQNT